MVPVEHGRYLAQQIAGAKLVEVPGTDHFYWVGNADAYVDHIEEFSPASAGGGVGPRARDDPVRRHRRLDREGRAARRRALAPAARQLLQRARRQLARFRGAEVDTAGDGFFASFDGPARAVRCAAAIGDGARLLGLEVRAGVHTGECEVMGAKIGGIAVHIGARVAGQASPGEVLVSSTVKDLVAGSGIAFEDRGSHALKGVPGQWHLYAASEAA